MGKASAQPAGLTLPEGKVPALRVVPMPADSNQNGDIFGGWIMAQVDLAGAVIPARIAKGRIATVAVKEFVFEDVHFDFDRYSLRPEATRALDEAIKTLQANPELRLEIEGHTCNIGTSEYNLALGERRASAVREYLAGRGIGADRLRTVSYGEERPKYDNAREETRRLNRRAALTVRLQ